MDPAQFDNILKKIQELIIEILNRAPPELRREIERELKALMAAVANARALGAGAAGASLGAVLEALKKLLEAMLRAGHANATNVRFYILWLETLMGGSAAAEGGAVAGGGAAAGAGAVLAASAIILALLALILSMMSVREVYLAKGPVAKPVGGPPCGNRAIARGLEAEGYSHWGQRAAFEDAETNARTAAQTFTCPTVACTAVGATCRGNCAIVDVRYRWRLFWTACEVTYDVYCECY